MSGFRGAKYRKSTILKNSLVTADRSASSVVESAMNDCLIVLVKKIIQVFITKGLQS